MSDWTSGDVTTNGIRIHYTRTGGGKPPLLLAHGATDSGLCWTRLARVLEADYDVIMPDARGHGQSEAPESGYTSGDHAADLAGLIRELGLDRPAIGGHSMGAGSTLALTAMYPDLVSCAVLEDPGIRMQDPPTPTGHDPRAEMRRNIEIAQTQGREAAAARGREIHPGWSDEEFGPWVDAKTRVSRQFMDQMGRTRPMLQWRELLPKVRCPMLLVTSDPERGGIVTPEAAQEAKQLLPSLQVVRVSGAGHNIRREQFEAFVGAVRAFLSAYYPARQAARA
ncbi:MAG: alpha/beta hydrolase [Chloroflexi bacterium]|nr:alpha/beta hydrolase [Chloroflexota bacterium]